MRQSGHPQLCLVFKNILFWTEGLSEGEIQHDKQYYSILVRQNALIERRNHIWSEFASFGKQQGYY